ncbi:hypothetical protein B0T10DRAFT_490074 [Thelonectria olida]|uniref:Uncharacterized protein n=1 Tax=Thelonectria olida TaxID=1576542 RepID=A0A9P8W1D2_9HYPO|nr:hypothetical protein B0T10DRAFT_490074 [Thelonectria olida]
MPRTIYLIVYNSRLFPAHWSFWIPSLSDPTIGKRIQATGNALTGFTVAFERNYDIEATNRAHELVALTEVDDIYIDDGDSCKGGPESTDTRPIDRLEEVALSVPAPGPSLVSSTSAAPRRRAEIKNCQTWLRGVVQKLIEEKMMDGKALDILDRAPKN